jgi:hypothetical protein
VTTPSLAKKKTSADGPRMYAWPPLPPHEFEVMSVTSAIGNGYPKPFLIPWAAKMSAECAVDDHEIISKMLEKGDEKAAIDHIKNARNRSAGAKADRGTIVHAALEAFIAKKPINDVALAEKLTEARVPRPMWKSTKGMIEGALKFLKESKIKVTHSEATVFSREHEYAGTTDIFGTMKIGTSVVPVVVDFKTGKSIYDDTAMQLTAYARGDFIGLDDGTELPVPKGIELGMVVRPMASGTYEPATFSLGDDVFELFLHCLAIAQGRKILTQSRRP